MNTMHIPQITFKIYFSSSLYTVFINIAADGSSDFFLNQNQECDILLFQ